MPGLLRLIRFARKAVLITDIWTILCAVLIIGWQVIIFFREAKWASLPLSSIFGDDRGKNFTTASIGETQRGDIVDALLQVQVIVPLTIAAVLLTAFYLWLTGMEKRYSGN